MYNIITLIYFCGQYFLFPYEHSLLEIRSEIFEKRIYQKKKINNTKIKVNYTKKRAFCSVHYNNTYN